MDSSVSSLSSDVPLPLASASPAVETNHECQTSRTHKLVPLPAQHTAINLALRALRVAEKRAGGGPMRNGGPLAHMRSVLASPTDKIMSPATRGVHDIRRKKLPKEKLKPQALSMVFESMKQK